MINRILLVLLFFPVISFGQNTINSIEGAVEHGSSIVINLDTGSFGNKVPAAPLVWDDFEDGTDDTWYNVAQDSNHVYTRVTGGTGDYVSSRPKWSSTRLRGDHDTMGLIQNFSNEIDGYRDKPFGYSGVDIDTFYAHGWCYRDDYNSTAQYCINYKAYGNFGRNGVGGYTHPQQRAPGDAYNEAGSLYGTAEDGTETFQLGTGELLFAPYWDTWMRIERHLEVDYTTGAGNTYLHVNSGNGFNIDYDGSAGVGNPAYPGGITDAGDQPMDYFLHGIYFSRAPTGGYTPALKVYWSEFYMDDSQARVELGDAATWDACSFREIQIPSAWATDEITVTVNLGHFQNTDAAWLYVVDETGVVGTGYAVTIGGEEEPPPQSMTAPTNLTATGGD